MVLETDPAAVDRRTVEEGVHRTAAGMVRRTTAEGVVVRPIVAAAAEAHHTAVAEVHPTVVVVGVHHTDLAVRRIG